MSERVCPNCGKFVPGSTSQCSCGFSWDEGEVPAPDIVRSAVQRRLGSGERETAPDMHGRSAPRPMGGPPEPRRQSEPDDQEDDASSMRATSAAAAFPNLGSFPQGARSPRRPPGPASRPASSPSRAAPAPVTAPPAVPQSAPSPSPSSPQPPRPHRSLSDSVAPQTGLLMDCPACGVRISKRAVRCPKCETVPWAFCLICASRILVNSESCSECGDPQPFQAPPPVEAR